MELEFRRRNNDLGLCFPTFQERINNMPPASQGECQAGSAAPALEPLVSTPHMPNADEVRMTIAQVEDEARQQSQELMALHSGLNERRVARLLGLLD